MWIDLDHPTGSGSQREVGSILLVGPREIRTKREATTSRKARRVRVEARGRPSDGGGGGAPDRIDPRKLPRFGSEPRAIDAPRFDGTGPHPSRKIPSTPGGHWWLGGGHRAGPVPRPPGFPSQTRSLLASWPLDAALRSLCHTDANQRGRARTRIPTDRVGRRRSEGVDGRLGTIGRTRGSESRLGRNRGIHRPIPIPRSRSGEGVEVGPEGIRESPMGNEGGGIQHASSTARESGLDPAVDGRCERQGTYHRQERYGNEG